MLIEILEVALERPPRINKVKLLSRGNVMMVAPVTRLGAMYNQREWEADLEFASMTSFNSVFWDPTEAKASELALDRFRSRLWQIRQLCVARHRDAIEDRTRVIPFRALLRRVP